MKCDKLEKAAKAATPGPWVYGKWVEGINESLWKEVWTVDKHGKRSLPLIACKHFDEEANARLIAAANPAAILELLAINAKLVEALKRYIEDYQGSYHSKEPTCMEMARAALAKAEGGEL